MQGNIEDLIASRFVTRHDVKAIQHDNGSYTPDRSPFTRDDLRAHTAGTKTFGHYQLGLDSTCKFLCFDLDWRKPDEANGYVPTYEDRTGLTDEDDVPGITRPYNPREAWLDPFHQNNEWMIIRMRTLTEALALRASREFLLGTAILYSGCKGFHVYCWVDPESKPVPAEHQRVMAHEILESFGTFERVRGDNFWRHKNTAGGYRDLDIEVFPKQSSLEGKDLGNLLRLPLGVNRKTGNASFFVDVNCDYNLLQPADPVEAMTYLNPWGGPAPSTVSADV